MNKTPALADRMVGKERISIPVATGFGQDVRYGLRGLARNPGFAAVAILMLALGIGINTTVFCWLDGLVLNPLPGTPDAGRIVAILPSYRGTIHFGAVPYPDYRDLAGLTEVFDGVTASAYADALLTIQGRSEWVFGRLVTGNTFDVLGVRPQLGRFFVPEEDATEGAHPVIVLSYGYWQRRFHGSPDVIGTQVSINQHAFTIIGVSPRGFQNVVPSDLRTDFWAPLAMHDAILNFGSLHSRTHRWVTALGRLRRGISVEQAQAAATLLSRQLAQAHPESNQEVEFKIFTLRGSPIGRQASFLPVLRLLVAVAIAVFLIVVANMANLLLARVTARRQEIATRLALGCSRRRLVRQLLTESLLLAALGGALGAILARGAVGLFPALVPTTKLPLAFDFSLSGRTLGVTMALAALTAVVFGVAPALPSRFRGLAESLREGGHRMEGYRRSRTRDFLVALEVGLASLLLIGAALCLRGLQKARHIDLGFEPKNLLYAELNLAPNGYAVQAAKIFDRQLRQRLAGLGRVSSVGLSTVLPLGDRNIPTAVVDVEGYGSNAAEDRLVSLIMISPGYFSTLGIPILDGRDFTDEDGTSARHLAVVDETMARRFWPGSSPIGRQFRMAAGVADSEVFTVVGVARSGKYRSLGEPPSPLCYLQYEQRPLAALFMGVLIRTDGPPSTMSDALRREIHSLNPLVEPLTVQPVEDYIEPAFAQAQMGATLLGVLGLTALVLATTGLYGVMVYIVGRRTREIGIRMALGAERRHVMGLVLNQTLTMVLIGEGIGLALAAGLTRSMASVLYGVSPTDPLIFGAVSLFFVAVALLACAVPVRRATRIDPTTALRCE